MAGVIALAIGGAGAADGAGAQGPAIESSTPAAGPAAVADVALPSRAGEAFRVTDRASGLWMAARLVGARDVPREDQAGRTRYRGVLAGGADEVHVARADGTEDLVVVPAPLAEPALSYELWLSDGVAGLRAVGGAIELLDRGGAPRLRVTAPFVVDAGGARHPATIAVSGCAADTSPRAPWGRPVTPPASRLCAVTVRWQAGLAHPIVVDPLWNLAGTMAFWRSGHTATRLANGRVLVAGGYVEDGTDNSYGITAELFDPTTKTWAVTGPLALGREGHDAAAIGDGRVLIVGGNVYAGDDTDETEAYDPVKGTFEVVGAMKRARYVMTVTALPGGRALAVGGRSRTANSDAFVADVEAFDPKSNTWQPVAPLAAARGEHGAVALADGRVVVAGGATYDALLASAEIFDPGTDTWKDAGHLGEARGGFAMALAGDGRVVVAGGYGMAPSYVKTAEAFDPGTGAWSSLPDLSVARAFLRAVTLQNGAVLVTGGEDKDSVYRTTEAFATGDEAWQILPWMSTHRTAFSLTPLLDGTVLAAAGDNGQMRIDSSELLTLLPTASPCDVSAACTTGFCADGVCCDARCGEACVACTAAKRGGGVDGQCGPVPKDTNARGKCKDTGSPACGDDGVCDGAGACEKYPAGGGCTPRPCEDGIECASRHCADGICCDATCDGPCEACTAAKKGHGVDGTCAQVTRGTDPDGECKGDESGSCAALKLCNGVGSCAVATEVCAPYVCAAPTGCASSCSSNDGCAEGFRCEKGACVATTTGCDGDHTVTTPAGDRVDCAPFRCGADGACKGTCASVDDCAEPSVCDRGGRCVSPPSKPDDAADRCTCRAPGGADAPRPVPIAAAILAAIAIGARRRPTQPRPRRPRSARFLVG